jgi:alpha-ketoglutarate-dependent 2,4-dichlorophenoxyacetate dioxygenase
VLVFRHASLDDARHVAFSALFGELDDIKPYLALGRKNRFTSEHLFDVSNLEDDGSLTQMGTSRHHLGLVSATSPELVVPCLSAPPGKHDLPR